MPNSIHKIEINKRRKAARLCVKRKNIHFGNLFLLFSDAKGIDSLAGG
jgi:hypothetical protein